MFELLVLFTVSELLALGVMITAEAILPETEKRPDPAAMMLGMTLVAVLVGGLALVATLAGVPMMVAAVATPAALAVLVAAVRIPLVEAPAARDRTAKMGLVGAAVLAATMAAWAAL